MSDPSYTDYLETAIAAARAGGEHAYANQYRRNEVDEQFAHDVKLVLDRETQAVVEKVLRDRYPEHAILGEEGGEADDSRPTWIVDPIDGTVNYFHGMPIWCCSVAIQVDRRIVAGAVYVPPLNELYTATTDGPALLNGEPIGPSKVASLAEGMVATGLSKNVSAGGVIDRLTRLSLSAQKVRIMGAAAVDICHVACGRADGYIDSGIYIWDVAAAGLIAERAGAQVEIIEYIDDMQFRYLCSNGLIHDDLKKIITDQYQEPED
ncbi:MAG: inositol monophosphatase [Verrucomicrobia bacterium]|nr:inositol monophosphatase [Verrucomicrobiota bacterium]